MTAKVEARRQSRKIVASSVNFSRERNFCQNETFTHLLYIATHTWCDFSLKLLIFYTFTYNLTDIVAFTLFLCVNIVAGYAVLVWNISVRKFSRIYFLTNLITELK